MDLRMVTSVPLFVDPCFSFLTELPRIQVLELLESCNGLVLFSHRRPEHTEPLGYVVCNPTTKQWQSVPTCDHSPPLITFTYLAFDPAVSPHFSLVQFEVDRYEEKFMSVRAYSSETGTWSRSQIDQHAREQGQWEGWQYQFIRPTFDLLRSAQCAFVNGVLHVIVWDRGQYHQLILAVDVQGKTRWTIAVPGATLYVCYVGQSQGLLHCITQKALDGDDEIYELSIWVLQDYDKQEWVLKESLSSLQLFVDKSCRDDMEGFEVIDIHQDRNVVFFALSNKQFITYDMSRKEVCVVATFDPEFFMDLLVTFPISQNYQPSQISNECVCSYYKLLAFSNVCALSMSF